MAVLSKLRNSTWVLFLVLVSLALFIISDYFSSNNKYGLSSGENVGEINGTDISIIEFDSRYKQLLSQMSANGTVETEETRTQASNYAWNQFIQSLIIDKEFNKLGVDVTVKEAGELLYSENAHPTIKQYFSRDGVFSPSNVLNFKNQMAKKDPKVMEQFEMIIQQVVLEVQNRKYNSLLTKSIYGTSLDAENEYYNSTTNYNGKSVTLNFASIEDKSIKTSDDELKDYINSHKDEFEQKASRDLNYILINVAPSSQDTLKIKEDLLASRNEFATTEDDSAYISLNSTQAYSGNFQSHGSFRKEFESKLFNSAKDSVLGPFYYDGGFSLFKVTNKKTDSVSYFHAIKVDLPVKGNTAKDTLAAMAAGKQLGIASNSAANSLDFFNSKMNTGEVVYAQDLGWMREGTQSEEINKAIKTLSAGQSTVVKSLYGLTLIKLIEPKSSELIQVAELRKPIEALQSTQDEAYKKASEFRNALNTESKEAFENAAKKFGLAKSVANNLKEEDRTMTGIPGTLEVIRWVYNEKRALNDISDVISTDNNLIVAQLVKIREEGTAEVEDVREKVTRLVINDKKAEMLKKKLEDAANSSKTLDEIATKVQSAVQPFYNINFFSNNVQFAGNDMKLVGYVCGLKPNVMSKPIVSNDGVSILLVEGVTKPEAPKDLDNRKLAMFDQKKQQVYNAVYEGMKKVFKVEDFRYKYY
jgi:peptidyl-prolyl cis-trans isomerase D